MTQADGTGSMADTTSRFDMSFVVTPPSQLSPQERVFLPVVVRVRPTIALPPNPREQLVLHATLVKTTGTVANDVLRGNTTDSIHSRDDNAHSGYAKFDCLAIQKPGEYRLRVWLSIATDTEVVSQQYIDSDIIVVADDAADGTSHSHAPMQDKLQILRALTPENLGISTSDIQNWTALAC